MHQTQKGKQWYFGLKAHIDVDRKRGLVHSLTTTSANVHDLHQLLNLMHGEKSFISANSSYRGVENRKETKNRKLSWLVTEIPSKIRAWKKHPRINKEPIRTEYLKTSIMAIAEHQFRIFKYQFGFRKAWYGPNKVKQDVLKEKLGRLWLVSMSYKITREMLLKKGYEKWNSQNMTQIGHSQVTWIISKDHRHSAVTNSMR